MKANIKVGDYVRTPEGISLVRGYRYDDSVVNGHHLYLDNRGYGLLFTTEELYAYSPNITDLIQCGDIVYVDIDNGYEGGIIVPRIAETLQELKTLKDRIINKHWILKSIVTREQINEIEFKID